MPECPSAMRPSGIDGSPEGAALGDGAAVVAGETPTVGDGRAVPLTPDPPQASSPSMSAATVATSGVAREIDQWIISAISGHPQCAPGRPAGRLDELDEDSVAGARVEERDRTLGTAPRRHVDELDALDAEAGQLF